MGTSLKRETTKESTAETTNQKKRRVVIPFTPEDWQQVLTILQGQMSQATFDVNLRGTRLICRQGDQLTIQSETPLAAERINRQLKPLIEHTLTDYAGQPLQLRAETAESSAPLTSKPTARQMGNGHMPSTPTMPYGVAATRRKV